MWGVMQRTLAAGTPTASAIWPGTPATAWVLAQTVSSSPRHSLVWPWVSRQQWVIVARP